MSTLIRGVNDDNGRGVFTSGSGHKCGRHFYYSTSVDVGGGCGYISVVIYSESWIEYRGRQSGFDELCDEGRGLGRGKGRG